jgi:hypothetical protein
MLRSWRQNASRLAMSQGIVPRVHPLDLCSDKGFEQFNRTYSGLQVGYPARRCSHLFGYLPCCVQNSFDNQSIFRLGWLRELVYPKPTNKWYPRFIFRLGTVACGAQDCQSYLGLPLAGRKDPLAFLLGGPM